MLSSFKQCEGKRYTGFFAITATLVSSVLLLGILTSTATAEAKLSKNITLSADASWTNRVEDEDGHTETYTRLTVTQNSTGTDISVSSTILSSESETLLLGHVFTTAKVFDMDKKLTSATLSPITIPLCVGSLYEPGKCTRFIDSTVHAQWTGVGEISKGNDEGKSLFRSATATGSVDEEDLGQTDAARLTLSK